MASTTSSDGLPDISTESTDLNEQTQGAVTANHDSEKGASILKETSIKPFSAFSRRQKLIIVCLTSISALFSPLTANIYLPSIPILARDFKKPVELINLSVTLYMIMQGLAPMVWGTLSDCKGRRLFYLVCLTILCLTCIGMALTPTNAFWLLLLLRFLQAAGSASTVALGSGTIVDIATREERGSFVAIFMIAPLFGPCLGPVLGGILENYLGWRWILWFMSIFSGAWCFAMFLIMPETLRIIVGDGSVPAPRWDRPPLPLIRVKQTGDVKLTPADRPPPKPVENPFRIFTHPDILVLFGVTGIMNSVFYGVITTISSLFQVTYPFLNETDVGLCFLSVGAGMIVGSAVTGKVQNRDYQRMKKAMIERDGEGDPNYQIPEEEFPIERARLRSMPIYLVLMTSSLVAYGWVLDKGVNLAVPLILLFVLGWVVIATMNAMQTLTLDLFPNQGSSISACNNVVRCLSGAALVAIIGLILDGVGVGWTMVILAGLSLFCGPLILVEFRMGPIWRERRRKRRQEQNNQ